jgi:hypothetical protein
MLLVVLACGAVVPTTGLAGSRPARLLCLDGGGAAEARSYRRFVRLLGDSRFAFLGETNQVFDEGSSVWRQAARYKIERATFAAPLGPEAAKQVARFVIEARLDAVILFNFDPGDGKSHCRIFDHLGDPIVEVTLDPKWSERGTPWRLSKHLDELAEIFMHSVLLHHPGF